MKSLTTMSAKEPYKDQLRQLPLFIKQIIQTYCTDKVVGIIPPTWMYLLSLLWETQAWLNVTQNIPHSDYSDC